MKKLISLLIILSFSIESIGIDYTLSAIRLPAGQAGSTLPEDTLRPMATKSTPVLSKQSSSGLFARNASRYLRAASFLRKKGAIANPEIIEILGEPHEHSDISMYPEYLRKEILHQEKEGGVQFRVARISGALATSYKGKETYLSDILFNTEHPAPYGLIYMYICHESEKHSGLNTEVKAVMREIKAWNSLLEEEQNKIKDWADWYVNEVIKRGIDVDENIIKDSFYRIAEEVKSAEADGKHPDDIMLMVEHYVTARYGEIHIKEMHDMQRRLHSIAAVIIFTTFFTSFLLGYINVFLAAAGYFSYALIYYGFYRYILPVKFKNFANDFSVIDDYKGVRDGAADEGRVYFKNMFHIVNAYKFDPFRRYWLERKNIIKLHFLSQIVSPKDFGKKTDRALAPKGVSVRSPVRSNTASLMLVEHFLASRQEIFSEPAWVALIEEASLNEAAWFDRSFSAIDLAVHLPSCAKKLVDLLYKAENNKLEHYKIKDMDSFRATLSKLIIVLADQNKNFKCRAILHLCQMHENKSNEETLFAIMLLRELKFYIVGALNFNQVSADIASQSLEDIIKINGHANLVLGAGNTITQPYQLGSVIIPSFAQQLALKKQPFNWNSQVKIWPLSEYDGLSPDNPSSLAHALTKTLFKSIFDDVERNVYFIGENQNPKGFVDSQKTEGGIDLIIAGVGSDGRIGFNFPGAIADPFSIGYLIKSELTPKAISSSQNSYPGIQDNPFAWTLSMADIIQPFKGKKPKVIILVLGSEKAEALKDSLEHPDSPLAKIMHELDTTVIIAGEAIRNLIPDYLERFVSQEEGLTRKGMERSLLRAKTSSAGNAIERDPFPVHNPYLSVKESGPWVTRARVVSRSIDCAA